MPAYVFEGQVPVVDPSAFVHPTAVLIGDVIVGAGCFIGPGASLRGDFGRIVVEPGANVQDNCIMHCGSNADCIAGQGATIGHGSVLHGCSIGASALVGMNAVVLDGAEIGEESLVAALSLVKSDMRAPPRSLVAGNPAKIVRTLAPDEVVWRADGHGEYQLLTRRSLVNLQPCETLPAPEPGRRRLQGAARAVRLKIRDV